uniref:Uncharacterized protein n=1 Tax=Candidatus Kentrum sp. TUN TaxID=2126343 RepID=A0A451A8N6_9GAMM|nr:MAG: hypothetical protein BECKTUN1418D_GA0071000_101823 [Candidatus Kentron sp. TUN]VFK56300.1 MAG: hypothetical protein BECKTUN1418F_GA0071002_108412 [Candidatus Kentron sp. TUN]VFK62392.1 MAG: hypothetical protein BECKTUN1418E_GA0071001_107913 [Candidatus Kentron sp. TUN]
MPKKIRELKGAIQKRVAPACEKAKGSHTKWMHPKCVNKLILSGKDGANAKPYQENNVLDSLQKMSEAK